jgi:transcriptional regulator with XRE-family HTH domain
MRAKNVKHMSSALDMFSDYRLNSVEESEGSEDHSMPKADTGHSARLTLGQYLASVREDRGFSLREVEKATNKVVSNAYLSQIENDQIKKPSPNILHALAELYGVSYEDLMERAGFVTPTRSRSAHQRHGRIATFADQNLTEEEEAELVQYLSFMRSRRKSGGQT